MDTHSCRGGKWHSGKCEITKELQYKRNVWCERGIKGREERGIGGSHTVSDTREQYVYLGEWAITPHSMSEFIDCGQRKG